MYAPRWKLDLGTPFVLPDQRLRHGASKSTRRRRDTEDDKSKTTRPRPPNSEQTIATMMPTTRRIAEEHTFDPPETLHITAPVRSRRGESSRVYAHGWKMELGPPSSCPTIVYGIEVSNRRDTDATEACKRDSILHIVTTNHA